MTKASIERLREVVESEFGMTEFERNHAGRLLTRALVAEGERERLARVLLRTRENLVSEEAVSRNTALGLYLSDDPRHYTAKHKTLGDLYREQADVVLAHLASLAMGEGE